MYARIPGAYPGIEVRGATLIEAGDLGATLRPPVGPGQSHGGGPGGEAPGSSWISEILLTLKQVLIAENLQMFYIYI